MYIHLAIVITINHTVFILTQQRANAARVVLYSHQLETNSHEMVISVHGFKPTSFIIYENLKIRFS